MFATFPSFSKLDYTQKDAYRNSVTKYPPLSDLSFSTLMIWWNFAHDLSAATLQGNLVLSYHLPGDIQNSGLCLVGTTSVDESVEAIFTELAQNGKEPRLVHVPSFVVSNLRFPERLNIVEEQDYNEYIVPSANLFPLETTNHNMRRKIKKFIQEAGECNIALKSLELSDPQNQQILLDSVEQWWSEFGAANDRAGSERRAIEVSIMQAQELGIQNLCLYVCGKLEGFVLYQVSHDGKYVIVNHLKVHYTIPRIFDYLTYAIAGVAVGAGIPYLNMEMDLGIPGLRMHKSELRPTDFFKKYTLTPKAS